MKKLIAISLPIILSFLLNGCFFTINTPLTIDLSEGWDTLTVLENPGKGWYHHLLDNGISKYAIEDAGILREFPAMDHFYLRLAWSYLEPEEGVYDWSYIDEVTDRYVPEGYCISFRISSKETGTKPNSVGQELNGVQYATPIWVEQVGAKGIVTEAWGTRSWTPEWNDPVYLEKLDNFHKAFAERYDGKSWVRYIDVGSIGEWGEGHTNNSTRIPPTVEDVKSNIDIYLKNYKRSQLVVTDDLLYWNKPDEDVNELYQYAIDNGLTLRDDSPMVSWYVDNYLETYTVSHPHFFDPLYKNKPTILELQHYQAVIDDGNWLGRNGEGQIEGKGISGADIVRKVLEIIHPTYIGYHGYMEQWLKDNPDLSAELANKCGYWYFPVSINLPRQINKGEQIKSSITWINQGVAPAYSTYELHLKLVSQDDHCMYEFVLNESNNLNWMPGSSIIENYTINLNPVMESGVYSMKIRLFSPVDNSEVLLGLNRTLRDPGGYYHIADLTIQ